MAWQAVQTATQLALTGSLQTVQESAADIIIALDPYEIAHVQLNYTAEATPTEDCLVNILASTADGATNPDDVPFMSVVIPFVASTAQRKSISITGLRSFTIEAALLDTDGSAGGDDVGSTLDVTIRSNGVNA